MAEHIQPLLALVRAHRTRLPLLDDEKLLSWLAGEYDFLFQNVEKARRKVDQNAERKKLEDKWGRAVHDALPKNAPQKKNHP